MPISPTVSRRQRTVAPDDVRQRIVEAANARFSHYGFNKTSLAEIAGDCSMSTTNLYRYFEAKDAIGKEIVSRVLASVEARLGEIAGDEALSCEGRLEAMVLARLEMMAGLIESTPHLMELVDYLHAKEIELLDAHLERTRETFAKVIARGTERGEFLVEDAATAARACMAATRAFYHPKLICDCLRTDLEGSAREVLSLLVNGLKRRGGAEQ